MFLHQIQQSPRSRRDDGPRAQTQGRRRRRPSGRQLRDRRPGHQSARRRSPENGRAGRRGHSRHRRAAVRPRMAAADRRTVRHRPSGERGPIDRGSCRSLTDVCATHGVRCRDRSGRDDQPGGARRSPARGCAPRQRGRRGPGLDHPLVRDAVQELARANIPVVTVVIRHRRRRSARLRRPRQSRGGPHRRHPDGPLLPRPRQARGRVGRFSSIAGTRSARAASARAASRVSDRAAEPRDGQRQRRSRRSTSRASAR